VKRFLRWPVTTVVSFRTVSSDSALNLTSGALHIHPVSKVLQFRTSLAYIDDTEQRERAARKASGSAAALDPNVSDVEIEDVKPKKGAKVSYQFDLTPLSDLVAFYSCQCSQGTNWRWFRLASRLQRQAVPYDSQRRYRSLDFLDLGGRRSSTSCDDPQTWLTRLKNLAVQTAFQKLALAEEKRVGLECTTKGLLYMKRLAEKHGD
jgi:hypothetical protein